METKPLKRSFGQRLLRVLKWTGITLISIILLAVAFIFLRSNAVINKQHDIPLVEVTLPTDEASIAEGLRQVRIEQCNGCHGPNLTGRVMVEDFMVGRLVSANIPQRIKDYSDAELYRLIRHGVKNDGSVAFVMPADLYYELKEKTVLNIMAYLRTLEVEDVEPVAKMKYGPMIRTMLAFKQFEPPVETMNHDAPKQYAETGQTPMELGDYLAHTSCAKCHGHDLQGEEFFQSPGLGVIVLYNREQFHHLLRTGEGATRTEVGEMTNAVKNHLQYLTDQEVEALYTYLEATYKHQDEEAISSLE